MRPPYASKNGRANASQRWPRAIGRGFITAYGENVETLTKSRRYGSKFRTVRKAVAAFAGCVGQSKIGRYEMPCGVTGAAKRKGLKGNLSAVQIE